LSAKATGISVWGPDGDETLSAKLEFSNGCVVTLVPFDERVATVWEIDLFTDKSRIRLVNGGARWEFMELAESEVSPGYRQYRRSLREETDPLFSGPSDSLALAVVNIVNHLASGEALICTGEDGLKSIEMVESIRRSGEER
jgi:predicted dehydrogenase